jgi:sterol 3beta-glucosyltransferase
MKACKNFDVLIASPLTFTWVYSIAEKLGKKWAVVNLSLPTQPTKEFPFAGFAFFDAPWYNLFTYRLLRYIYWQLNKKEVREHRAALGLPPLKKSILKKISEQNILSLYSFSPSLIHRPRDWDDNIDITGFLTMPNKDTEEPDPELIAWLTNGEPPIYFGFGSIPIPDSKLFANILNELLASTDHRFIFCQGWSQLPDLPHNERLFIIKQINHGWLFPQCKIAVIHGGIGTVAAALKARIPVIIVSIFADQPLWGKIIAGKNLGVHIPFKKLTTEKLSDAIRKTQAPEMIKSVAEIGEKINNEGGLGSTINKIEDYFR